MLPRDLLPSQFQHKAFIAGGYAACPALANDIDVWIPVYPIESRNPWEELVLTRKQILIHLEFARIHRGFNVEEQDGDETVRATLRSTFEGYCLPLPIRRAAAVQIPGASLPYHLVLVAGDIDEVLSSFDISTHQIALTEYGVVKGEHWTPLWEPPVIIQHKFTTTARIEKIRARYSPFTVKESDDKTS